MANEYATLAELKGARRIPLADTTEDVTLQSRLTRASRAIDRRTGGRRFYADTVATARRIPVLGNMIVRRDDSLLVVDDISSETGLVVEYGDGVTYSVVVSGVSGYLPEPGDALSKNEPITAIRLNGRGWTGKPYFRITAKWGWPAIPDDISEATLLLANRRFTRLDSPEGVAGWGSEGPIRVSRFDSDIEDLVGPYVLPGF